MRDDLFTLRGRTWTRTWAEDHYRWDCDAMSVGWELVDVDLVDMHGEVTTKTQRQHFATINGRRVASGLKATKAAMLVAMERAEEMAA